MIIITILNKHVSGQFMGTALTLGIGFGCTHSCDLAPPINLVYSSRISSELMSGSKTSVACSSKWQECFLAGSMELKHDRKHIVVYRVTR